MLLLREPSRAAGLPRPRARLALAAIGAVLLLSLLALAAPVSLAPATAGADRQTDLDLYAAIVDGVRNQGHYYQVAADALRSGGYPLKPFLAFRLPTLAVLEAMLPPLAVSVLLWLLSAATLLAWYGRLATAVARLSGRLAVVLLLLGGSLAAWQADLAPFHELWAGLLVALSLARHRPGRWLEAVALGLAAAMVRETAALYPPDHGHRWQWSRATGARRSPGARRWGCSRSRSESTPMRRRSSPAHSTRSRRDGAGSAAPASRSARWSPRPRPSGCRCWSPRPLTALGVAGWAGWRDPLAVRVLATLGAYLALLALFARADNFYWALMVAPLALGGLAFAPDMLRDLFASALDRRRITVRRVVR